MEISMNTQHIIETQLPGSVIKVSVVKQNKTKSPQNVKELRNSPEVFSLSEVLFVDVVLSLRKEVY